MIDCCKIFVRLALEFAPMYMSWEGRKTAAQSPCNDLELNNCKSIARMLRNIMTTAELRTATLRVLYDISFCDTASCDSLVH